MKKLLAIVLVLGFTMVPAFATLTPSLKGMIQTQKGYMVWGTFTGLPTSGATATTITIPRINKITSLSTWAASVVSTQGAVAIIAVSKGVITVSQEATGYGISSGYFWVTGK